MSQQYFAATIATAPEHHAWMQQTLSDPNRMLLLVDVNRRAAGMVRLDRLEAADRERTFETSIAADPSRHGCGIRSAVLALFAD